MIMLQNSPNESVIWGNSALASCGEIQRFLYGSGRKENYSARSFSWGCVLSDISRQEGELFSVKIDLAYKMRFKQLEHVRYITWYPKFADLFYDIGV